MKKFKISESRIRRVIKEEVSRALSEQVDGPVGMDLQLGAERARQGRNPRTGTQETAPVEEEEEEDLSVPYCRKTGTSREPGFSIFTDENLSRGFRQLSSGYVELTDPNCRGVRVAFGEDANWAGVTGTLDGAVSIFFDQREMAGMIFQPGSGPASNLGEWWLANQLLKYDVGYSRRRERVVDDPEPVKFSEDPGDQLFGGPMEENLIKEDPDYLDDARNPSNPTDYSQWTSRDSFDNPYAQDIYEKLWDANTSPLEPTVVAIAQALWMLNRGPLEAINAASPIAPDFGSSRRTSTPAASKSIRCAALEATTKTSFRVGASINPART